MSRGPNHATMARREIEADIAVLGGGPAGCVLATQLAGFGHRVTIISRPRRHDAIEGMSERALKGLRYAGFENALAALGPMVRRSAEWNGERRDANREWLVDRPAFDAALLKDAARLGVRMLAGTVRRTRRGVKRWAVAYTSDDGEERALVARFVVDARGRATRRGAKSWTKGPAAFALARRCRSFAGRPPGTAVIAAPDGWAWLADAGDDRAIAQLFVSGDRRLPPRTRIDAFFEREIARIVGGDFHLEPIEPTGVRDAATAMRRRVIVEDFAWVGDAALAIDPLSGHGLFEAVSGALCLAAVVNTAIRRPDDAALARRFYGEKIDTDFWRLARVGRDFYRAETRFAAREFWRVRRTWPDDAPSHESPSVAPPRIERRPVLSDGYVVARDVVVTPDYPRGIWQVAGVPLADLLALGDVLPAGSEAAARAASDRLGRPGADIEIALAWLRRRGMLPLP